MFVKVIYNKKNFNHSCYSFHWGDLYTCNELNTKREESYVIIDTVYSICWTK